MSQIKILVVEDELIIADSIIESLDEYGYRIFEPAITYTEAIEALENEKPDIAILDIHLSGKKTGIDVANEINNKYKIPFIFLTSNSDKKTINNALIEEPYAFLVKPFSKEELYASIELALFNFSKKQEKVIDKDNLIISDALFIKEKQKFIRVNFKEILYLKSDNVYIDIFLSNKKKYTVRGTLNDYLDKMNENFLRIHRSHIVNLDYLDSINSIYVQVNGNELPIGKKYRDDLLTKIQKA